MSAPATPDPGRAYAPAHSHGAGHLNISLFNLAAIGLLIAMAGITLAYVIEATIKPPAPHPTSAFEAPFRATTVGGVELIIPKLWFRDSLRTEGSFTDQTSLTIWVKFNQVAPARPVDATFMPLSSAQPSAYLLDRVYLRQFQAAQVQGPSGLVGKPLVQEDGFQHETVWYDPLSPRPFVAKCMDAISDNVPARCMRTIQGKESLAVTFEFDFADLANWRAFDSVMTPYLTAIGAL
ncbi:MAG: hypothetical protein H6873_10635 [Hyphomicrobiaceae bacterium]|nr:hypothetical protein [Hyphomicrobiaceae bacterium]